MSPIQGFIRFRKHQVGKQASLGSNIGAGRILPYRGPIVVDPARTDPDVDTGSIDPILAPFLGPLGVTGTWVGKEAYNDAPYLWAGTIKAGVSPTGTTAKTYTFQAASLTADTIEYFTDQWYDDVTSDTIVGGGGVIDSLELGFGEDLSAWDVNATLVYATATFGAGPTGGLNIDTSPAWVYGANTLLFIDTAPGSIGITPYLDQVHGATLSINNNLDQKRFANGSNASFSLAGYGRGPREIELQVVLAKSTQSIAEAQTLDDLPVSPRYIELRTTSTEVIPTTATPYSQSIRMPMRLFARSDNELNNNSTITLTYRAFYDPTLLYAIRAVVVCSLTSIT